MEALTHFDGKPTGVAPADGQLLYSVDDRPEAELLDGTRAWCKEGLLRQNGRPATRTVMVRKYQWRHEERHREEGPVDPMTGEIPVAELGKRWEYGQ